MPSVLTMPFGVGPVWVNSLIWATVAARLVSTFVYLVNIGRPIQGIRTGVFVLGWALNVVMVVLVIVAAL